MDRDSEPATSHRARMARRVVRIRRRLTRMPWKTLALLLAFAVVNAFRRGINSRLLWEEPVDWIEDMVNITLTGFFVAACVVFAVMTAFDRFPRHGLRRAVALIAAAVISSAVGTLGLAWWEGEVTGMADDIPFVRAFLGSWGRYALLGLLFAWAYAYYRDREEARAAMRQSEVDRAELERRIAESRLMLLQAQIEPHFLFNTLAHVRRLYETDRASARTMLENLRAYLAVALPRMREPIAPLGGELALAEAYLGMQKTRMGRRLDYSVDVPGGLLDVRMPTMIILTLVENAIKHGIAPLREGGSVRISARAANARVTLEVADSGRGFVATSGGGAGLANLRARLAILYGSRATLSLKQNQPRGVSAILTLPDDGAPGIATTT